MEVLTAVDVVRKRPGMYVGETDDGSGLLHMVLEIVGNAYDQHLAGRCTAIDVDLDADGTITIRDDGPGMRAEGGDGVPALDVLLSRISMLPTVDGHRPHVHLGAIGVGLFVVNALSETFALTTVRDGAEARACYRRGVPVEPIATSASASASGTVVRFRPDPAIFRAPRVPRVELTRELEDLSFLTPELALRWRIAGDDVARGGLAARVALGVGCDVAQVAAHRATYELARGPVEVDVALAWRRAGAGAAQHVDSFVNLRRTRLHGRHVHGVIDGIRAFFGCTLEPSTRGLVAAIAVLLSDVKYGSPTKDRLVSDEVRAPVAEATRAALASWAAANPAAAAAVRVALSAP